MKNRQSKMKRKNLNNITKRYTDFSNMKPSDELQVDYSKSVSATMHVESIFKDLDKRVIEKIRQADAVVGCIAWLTNKEILLALSRVRAGVSIIVQKEDFLRPDLDCDSSYDKELRGLYSKLLPIHPPLECQFEKITNQIGEISDTSIDLSIRCVGYAKKSGESTLPRMHHKFLVFCSCDDDPDSFWGIKPYAVWTGSFNMTFNATQSIENAVYIENYDISNSYFLEWYNMLMISEKLNWDTPYSMPDIQLNSLAIIS